MQYINAHAPSGVTAKIIMNLYYPGYAANNRLPTCTDPITGQTINKQDKFLDYMARSNWHACKLAGRYGFQCADAFAELMGADVDTNGDGRVDAEALRYVEGESREDYVNRIMVTLRDTVRDPNFHVVNSNTTGGNCTTNAYTSCDYILYDNVHPTYYGNLVPIDSDSTRPPDFSDSEIVDGKNPMWDQYGHERLGWVLSNHTPDSP